MYYARILIVISSALCRMSNKDYEWTNACIIFLPKRHNDANSASQTTFVAINVIK